MIRHLQAPRNRVIEIQDGLTSRNKRTLARDFMVRSLTLKGITIGILTLIFLFPGETTVYAAPAEGERVLVYPSIAVAINKSVVIRLPTRAIKVAVTQPLIAEVVVVAPDELLIHGRSVGTTSLVVWLEEGAMRKE